MLRELLWVLEGSADTRALRPFERQLMMSLYNGQTQEELSKHMGFSRQTLWRRLSEIKSTLVSSQSEKTASS